MKVSFPWGTFFAAAALLLGGAFALSIEPNGMSGTGLFAAGLIMLGVFIATEVRNVMHRHDAAKAGAAKEDDEKPDSDDDGPGVEISKKGS